MKIKTWLSGVKKWAAKLLEWMVTDGATGNDDWWGHSGGFPRDF